MATTSRTMGASLLGGLAGFLAQMRSARAAAAAVEAGFSPRPSDLARLGIEPAAFAAIRLR